MRFMVALTIFGALAGCAESVPKEDYDKLAKELESTTARAAAAERELDELKNGPARLLAEAKAAMESKRFEAAVAATDQLLSRHPSDSRGVEAAAIKAVAEREVSAAAERRRQDEEKARQAEKARRATALKSLAVKKDEIRDIEFYRHKDSTKYVNSRSEVQLYFAARQGRPQTLFLVIQYVAEDWLFIDHLTIKADDQVFEIIPQRGDLNRDNGGGDIWEWYETSVGSREQLIVDAMLKAKSVTIRHHGRQYYKDRKVSPAELERMKQVLLSFRSLG